MDVNALLAQSYGLQKQLLLARDWIADMVLEVTGDGDRYRKRESAAATPRRMSAKALFRAIRHFPELLSLLPARPESAVT